MFGKQKLVGLIIGCATINQNWVFRMRLLGGVTMILGLFLNPAVSPLAAQKGLQKLTMADRVLVYKGQRRLTLMHGERIIKTYRVSLGRYAKGPKKQKGDAKTPEGLYIVDYRIGSDRSKFYKALHISYPNAQDRRRAALLKVDPGGQIMIHGLPTNWSATDLGHPELDWTQGCIAVTNREMDEIWAAVSDGTTVQIYP